MPPTGKSLKNRLMNYKYYYTYGLFDVVRRHEKNILTRISPEDLHTVAIEDARQCDSLILVSSDYPITTDRTEALVSLDEKNLIAGEAVQPLAELIRASEAACGEKILFTSVYRTLAFQESIYGVNPFAAKPGESEHHSGLSADIKVEGYAQRRFIMSKTGKWMAKNAHRFGFIIRYPLWAEKRTGVDYEPWHLRYVGNPHAEMIYRMKITLEEYLALIETGAFYRYGNTVISRQTGEKIDFPKTVRDICVSRDSRGGYIAWGTDTV